MKKLFTLVAMALMAVGANAQTKIAEVDFTTAAEFTGWTQFDDSQTDGKVELQAGEALAITVGVQTGQLWQPQIMVIPDGSFNLAEDGDYKVVVTAKFPTAGTLQINMGSWSANDQAQFPVEASDDYQTVECDFSGWSVDAEGAHLLFQCGDFKGTTLLKSVEVYDMAGGGAETVLYENDFTGITEFTGWSQFDDSQTDGKVEVDPDGVAITVGIQTGQLWQPQVMVIPDGSFNLKEDGNYKVYVTAKFPSDGTLQINMGTWSANDQAQFPVEATGDFQTVECDFEGWSVDAEGAHLLFQCGDFKGTTLLKSVEVYDMAGGGAETVLYENDFTGITEFTGWSQFDDSQTDGKVEVDPDGVAITVGIQTGQLWQPQVMVIPDGSFNLKEDGNYKVYVTAKFPSDGTLQINMGTWSANDQAQFPVEATGDFQTVECDFEGWSVDAEGAHLLFQCGDFKGTTILKSIKVVEIGEGGEPVAEDELLYENDFTGITEFTGWSQFDDSQTDGKVEVNADGVAITVGIQTGQLWQPQVMIVPDGSFNLAEDGDYKVVVTAKFPSDGTLQINMGTWSANDQAQFPVTATGDFQEVVCEFPGWSVDAEGAHLLFQCGDFKGTTILKKIQIYATGATGIKGVKTVQPISTAIYNLKGQKVDASYKGIVIKDGKKYLQK